MGMLPIDIAKSSTMIPTVSVNARNLEFSPIDADPKDNSKSLTPNRGQL